LSVAGSAAVTQALNLEAIAANRTALAHHMLARARGGGGAVGGAVASATGSAIGSAAGGVGTAAAGGGIGAAVVAGIKSAGAYIGTALGAVITAPVAIAAAGAVVAGGAAYYVMTKGDRDAASESEETTKRVEHWSKLFQLEQGHLQKLARIREGAEQQRASLARSVSDASFEDRMGLMRTPGEKLSAMDGRVSALTLERNAAAARVSANTEIDANTGAPRLNEDGQQMLEELIAAEERLLDAEKTRYALTREIEGEKRKLRMDEIKGIEDIIRSRQKERDELEKGYQTAKERFGALDRVDQKKALGALEKARSGADLTRTDLDRLRNIGTDESDQFIRDANNKSAEKAGFDVANRGAIDAKQMAIDEANNASIATLAAQPGQSEKEIRENLAKPVKVDLVNYETLNVQLNQEENVLFDKVVAEIQRLRKQQAESLERRIQEAEFAKIEEATNEYRTSVGGIQN
jgi:hypothetical protein